MTSLTLKFELPFVQYYKPLYKPLAKVIGNGEIRIPTCASDSFATTALYKSIYLLTYMSNTVEPISTKLETYNYLPKTTRHSRQHVAASSWVVWMNTQFATRFLSSPFWFLRLAPRSHRLTDLHQNHRVSAILVKYVAFGVSMMTNHV